MFVTIGDTEPRWPFPPSLSEFLFFNDPRNGDTRSVDRHGGIAATVAAALSEASGAPPLAAGATRVLINTGSQATCLCQLASFGITQKAPPTGKFGLHFMLIDGGNGRHAVENGGALSIVTVGGGAPIKISKAVYPGTRRPSVSTSFRPASWKPPVSPRSLTPTRAPRRARPASLYRRHRGLFYLGIFTATYLGGVGATLIATRRRRRIPAMFTGDTDDAPPRQ